MLGCLKDWRTSVKRGGSCDPDDATTSVSGLRGDEVTEMRLHQLLRTQSQTGDKYTLSGPAGSVISVIN
jgi:hypothetical protein